MTLMSIKCKSGWPKSRRVTRGTVPQSTSTLALLTSVGRRQIPLENVVAARLLGKPEPTQCVVPQRQFEHTRIEMSTRLFTTVVHQRCLVERVQPSPPR